MSICLFEDFSISTLLPLTHLHPDFDLRSGVFTLRERVGQYFENEALALFTRMGLSEVMAERTSLPVNNPTEPDVFINGSAILRSTLVHAIRESRGEDHLFTHHGILLAATVVSDQLREKLYSWLKTGLIREELVHSPHSHSSLEDFPAPLSEVEHGAFRFPWDLITWNRTLLEEDADFFMPGTVHPSANLATSVELIAADRIFIGADVRIGAGAVIDATDGPVIIESGVQILPQALIMGPAAVGRSSRVKAGAKLYGGTTIGPVCKVGGEVEDTLFHSYANKQHDGFVGHSYLGPWTNLGADTNTSDLKNNYSAIRVTLEGRSYDTGRMFLGTIMADHSKCGINTMFNTGTVVGVGCNIFGADFPPKFLPSFSWGGATGLEEYDFDRFASTASAVMARRDRPLTENERRLLRDVFVQTSAQRNFAS
ncbi:MAG: hypothetical protein JXA28_06820 [Bacteroidetes bacterium]|nr:hypothetical protein [Bacteroidota bacterium]